MEEVVLRPRMPRDAQVPLACFVKASWGGDVLVCSTLLELKHVKLYTDEKGAVALSGELRTAPGRLAMCCAHYNVLNEALVAAAGGGAAASAALYSGWKSPSLNLLRVSAHPPPSPSAPVPTPASHPLPASRPSPALLTHLSPHPPPSPSPNVPDRARW